MSKQDATKNNSEALRAANREFDAAIDALRDARGANVAAAEERFRRASYQLQWLSGNR